MGDQSARQVTGVGPRHAITFNGTAASGIVTDQIVGTGVIASSKANEGVWHVTHNLGKTGYCVQVTAELTAGNEGIASIFGRHGNTFGVRAEDAGGSAINPAFIHCVIYD